MILYAVTAILFLILDGIILAMVVIPLFIRHLGALMRYCPMLVPAALFYLDYLAGHMFPAALEVDRLRNHTFALLLRHSISDGLALPSK